MDWGIRLVFIFIFIIVLVCCEENVNIEKERNEVKPSSKKEFNFASADVGAKIFQVSEQAMNPKKILNEDKDQYMMIPSQTDGKYVIIELSETISLHRFAIANFEVYACSVKSFQVLGLINPNEDEWELLGEFTAEKNKEVQTFALKEPKLIRYFKFLYIDMYDPSQFYCTLSLVRVHGHTLYQDLESAIADEEKQENDDLRKEEEAKIIDDSNESEEDKKENPQAEDPIVDPDVMSKIFQSTVSHILDQDDDYPENSEESSKNATQNETKVIEEVTSNNLTDHEGDLTVDTKNETVNETYQTDIGELFENDTIDASKMKENGDLDVILDRNDTNSNNISQYNVTTTASKNETIETTKKDPKKPTGSKENILKSLHQKVKLLVSQQSEHSSQLKGYEEKYKEAFTSITTALTKTKDEINMIAESVLTLKKKMKSQESDFVSQLALKQSQWEQEIEQKIKLIQFEYEVRLEEWKMFYIILGVLITIVNLYISGILNSQMHHSDEGKSIVPEPEIEATTPSKIRHRRSLSTKI